LPVAPSFATIRIECTPKKINQPKINNVILRAPSVPVYSRTLLHLDQSTAPLTLRSAQDEGIAAQVLD